MINKNSTKIYRALLLICAVYFIAVTIAHQIGIKLPMLFIFYSIPSERYQDLIISFLSFGWATLFGIGFFDSDLKMKIQAPILFSGLVAICGLIRVRLEIKLHNEIDYEIGALAILLFSMMITYIAAIKKKRETTSNEDFQQKQGDGE
ncbi:MAG: hypothetical protein HZB81_02015 [Deltaproteobacteria bacterium]|nr:hypothetical protein [Deltaproteobacteria bacterium]